MSQTSAAWLSRILPALAARFFVGIFFGDYGAGRRQASLRCLRLLSVSSLLLRRLTAFPFPTTRKACPSRPSAHPGCRPQPEQHWHYFACPAVRQPVALHALRR